MGFCGFVHGSFPPAKTWNFTAAGKHMCHLFRAHDAVYRAIKRMPGESLPGAAIASCEVASVQTSGLAHAAVREAIARMRDEP